MSSPSALEVMLKQWKPPTVGFDVQQIDSLNAHWDELVLAGGSRMWRSSCLLAGQIVEALLRAKLESVAVISRDERLMFGNLLDRARKGGILANTGARLGENSISAARVLRNWASHYDLWASFPTEVRATQSVALMICAAQALYPPDFTPFEVIEQNWDGSWRQVSPGFVVAALNRLPYDFAFPERIEDEFAEFCRHVVRTGKLSVVYGLHEVVKNRTRHAEHFGRALENEFTYLVAHAAATTEKRLASVVDVLKRHGLRNHALIYAILLPIDLDIFVELVQSRPAAWLVFYLTESIRAEPDVFLERINKKGKLIEAAKVFWKSIRKTTNILSAANVIAQMPVTVRAVFMGEAPVAELLEWVRSSQLLAAVNLCVLLRSDVLSHRPSLTKLRDSLVEELVKQIQAASVSTLPQLPLRLHQMKVINDPVGDPLVLTLLIRVRDSSPETEDEWDAVRRILQDFWSFSNRAHQAAELAASIVQRNYATGWTWPLLCIAGICEARSPGVVRSLWNMPVSEPPIPPGVDRWQLLFATLTVAALSSDGSIPEYWAEQVVSSFPNTSRVSSEKSIQLMLSVEQHPQVSALFQLNRSS